MKLFRTDVYGLHRYIYSIYIYIHVIVLDLFNRFIKQIDIAILDI